MPARAQPILPLRLTLPTSLLIILLLTLWVAGGASRPDTLGQVVARAVSAGLLVVFIMWANRPSLPSRPLIFLIAASAALLIGQLVPLSPSVWLSLPGRDVFAAAVAGGGGQPWRPLSIMPSGTINALFSLTVPAAALFFGSAMPTSERSYLLNALVGLTVGSMVLGLIELSSGGFDNPLVNDTAGQVAGLFANRNHFALLLAVGCLLAPVWAFQGRRWRLPFAFGTMALFLLVVVASGSRAGMALAGLAIAVGFVLSARDIKRLLRRYPRWVLPALVSGVVATLGALLFASYMAGRGASIVRAIENSAGEDMRARALPVLLDLIQQHVSLGAGFGTFDPIFRMSEPFGLLKPTYFNHAHNDWLEVLLDGGIPGAALAVAALVWWAWASVRAWRLRSEDRDLFPKLGSAILAMVFIASIFDYPARTPLIMAIIAIAAVWLQGDPRRRSASFTGRVVQPIGDAH